MFATETWHKSNKVYGDGNCALFRLKPNPVCYQWSNEIVSPITKVGAHDSFEALDEANIIKTEAMLGHFMVGKDNFISMGTNEDGTSGLRLNEDLSKGSSSRARGFNNDPLAGDERTEFDIGLVEVYQLLREMDGKAIDGEEDIWKGMFD